MSSNSPETQHLLDQARDGQEAAVNQLLDAHREPLRRAISLRLDPVVARREDPSDIVQKVLLEANQRLSDYLRNPTMPFHLWLRHIAQDHIIDTHRRHRVAQRRSLDREQPIVPAALADRSSVELAAQFLDQELTPASAAMRHELENRLHVALASLDEGDRDVICMRHFEQLSNQDVALILNLTEAAASMRYLRALRRLKALLAPEPESGQTD
jgi:RNA polymerase sigma-70 factor, ECF subfamily